MNNILNFTIKGNPKALKRHRHHKFGTYNPSKKDMQDFFLIASEYKPAKPFSGRVIATIKFYFKRPKSHYRTGKYSKILKTDAPRQFHSQKPDIDNLIKFVLDSIQGEDGFITDDSIVCKIEAYKMWTDKFNPRTEINLLELQS